MNKANHPPINPFLAAQRESGVHVSLDVHDVLAVEPDWTQQQAIAFMDRHSVVIAHAMLNAGTNALKQLLENA